MNEQTKQRITKEAEAYATIFYGAKSNPNLHNRLKEAYDAGATRYAQRSEKLREAVEKAIEDMKYVAFNIDGRTIDDLRKGVVESTSYADTALIVIRNLISALNQSK